MRERHYSSPLTSSMPEGRGLLLHSGCHLNHFQCQMFESAAFCTALLQIVGGDKLIIPFC